MICPWTFRCHINWDGHGVACAWKFQYVISWSGFLSLFFGLRLLRKTPENSELLRKTPENAGKEWTVNHNDKMEWYYELLPVVRVEQGMLIGSSDTDQNWLSVISCGVWEICWHTTIPQFRIAGSSSTTTTDEVVAPHPRSGIFGCLIHAPLSHVHYTVLEYIYHTNEIHGILYPNLQKIHGTILILVLDQ